MSDTAAAKTQAARPLIGHRTQMERLRRSVEQGRVSNAYLMVGPDGIGKTTVARWFAQLLSCQEPDRPCGRCERCRRLAEGSCPDLTAFEEASHPYTLHQDAVPGASLADIDAALGVLHEAELLSSVPRGLGQVRVCHRAGPDVTATDPDAEVGDALKKHALDSLPLQLARLMFLRAPAVRYARTLKIDLMRRYVIRQVALRPVEMRYRVFLLDDAHNLPMEAQNALLKTLEEPPPSSVLLLVTSRPNLLLPTIASRCQTLKFQGLADEQLQRLLEGFGASAEDARLAASLAGGSVLRALDFSPQEHRRCRDALLDALEPKATRTERIGALQAALGCADTADRSERFRRIERQLGLLLELLRDGLILAQGATAGHLRHRENEARLARLAAAGGVPLKRAAELVLDGLDRMHTNANADLQMVALSSRLHDALGS